MPFPIRTYLPLAIIGIAGVLALVVVLNRQPPASPAPPKPEPELASPPKASLSVLAEPPAWEKLKHLSDTLTRSDFERLLTDVFTTSDAWKNFIQIDDQAATIQTGAIDLEKEIRIDFAAEPASKTAARYWKETSELPPFPPGKPLAGLHIAIDPGHIGGKWAKMEERWFAIGDGKPVTEGDMTLFVANLLKTNLEILGATVSLVRDQPEPVTTIRPDELMDIAENPADDQSPAALQKLAERLFYRTAEIRARASIVNDFIKPDLVLCLHFNAEAWGDPNNPVLIDRTHFHLLLNGAYNTEEVALADQRFAMLHKIFQGIHREEAFVGSTVAATFAEISGLPAYQYSADSTNVRSIDGNPFLWARNLLANRLYDCPVIYMEPYVMNSTIDYARIQEGDYDGLREIAGTMRPSIFREYADALAEGLRRHYSSHRAVSE